MPTERAFEKPSFSYEWTDKGIIPLDLSEKDDWQDGESFPDWFRRLGYEEDDGFGDQYGDGLHIYRRSHGEGHPFIADVSLVLRGYVIFLPSFDAWVRLVSLLSPRLFLGELLESVKNTEYTIAKFFRAEHGHYADNICSRCDPSEYRDREQRREARKAAKAKEEAEQEEADRGNAS